MFIHNKYHKWYMQLCSSRQKLNRVKNKDEYFENHHIIPRSLGGGNEKSNLVLLTAREHFIAHLLLTKFTICKYRTKMIQAIWLMSHTRDGIKINSKIYESLKMEFSEAQKLYVCSEETKVKLSTSKLGKLNHRYGKPQSKLQKKKLLEAHLGRKNSKETKTKMSKSHTGKNNAKFIGYYITPFGKLVTRRDIKNHTDLIGSCACFRWCKNPDKIISKGSFSKSKYLQSLGKCVIGKSFRDLGFDFIHLNERFPPEQKVEQS